MRTLIIIAICILLLALVGWITFSGDGSRSSINLETNEIRDDTQQVIESGADLLRDAGTAIDPDSHAQDPPRDPGAP
jgi:hypothetical protein